MVRGGAGCKLGDPLVRVEPCGETALTGSAIEQLIGKRRKAVVTLKPVEIGDRSVLQSTES